METSKPSLRETRVSLLILTLLGGIATGVFFSQYRSNPAVLTISLPPTELSVSAGAPAGSESILRFSPPEGLTVMTPPEVFLPRNLSDKIDGKAELYLSAGFKRLDTARWRLAARPESWVEIYAYDMGEPRNAFSVYSTQMRDNGTPTDIAQDAYFTGNAVFLAHGPFYVEIVSGQTDPETVAALQSLARRFVDAHPVAGSTRDEAELFPAEGRVPGQIALISSNGFGFERLDNLYIAPYRFGSEEATGFLSDRGTAAAARSLASEYADFLLSFGGKSIPAGSEISGARMVDIMGTYELIFTHGRYLAGVHEAGSKITAMALAGELKKSLEAGTDGTGN